MSTREIQPFIHQPGTFLFLDGRKDQGVIIARYNIKEGKVEYYFIPAENELAYKAAHANHDMEAHRRLGHQIDTNSVLSAQLRAA